MIVSLVFYSKDNDVFLLLLFTWSIKCLSCTSSSLRSLLWRWAFNLVKNSFCLLMSVAKIKEPSCCSISCLHPQEWKRKHTQSKSLWAEWLTLSSSGDLFSYFCLWYCWLHRVLVPCSPSVIHPPSLCPWMGGMPRTEQSDWNLGWTKLWQFIRSHSSYGIGSQREMYAWRRSQRLTESLAFGLCIL